jgi:hypothetical protein
LRKKIDGLAPTLGRAIQLEEERLRKTDTRPKEKKAPPKGDLEPELDLFGTSPEEGQPRICLS